MKLNLDELLSATKSGLMKGSDMVSLGGVSIDSRTIKKDDIFFAIRGDRFDGHDFIEEALKKGASGVVLERMPETVSSKTFADRSIIIADDTRRAIGGLASFWRRRNDIKVVAVGGSCGKTTTKEMVSSILSLSHRVLKTDGNFNNDIGLPMTIFKIREDHDIAVLELGVSNRGEMSGLVEMASPDVALITNIGKGHLSGFRDLNVVAQEKGGLFRGLKPGGTAIVNMDDPLIMEVTEGIGTDSITYGIDSNADVCLKSYTIKGHEGIAFDVSVRGKTINVEIKTMGIQNIMNALSAIAVALSLNCELEDMKKGLANFIAPEGRMHLLSLREGVKIIDDTYNANPTSMEASLKTFSQVKGEGKGIAILGDMLDLGEESERAHIDIGRLVAELRIDQLFYMGRYGEEVAKGALLEGMNGGRVRCADRKEDILPEIIDMVKGGESILVKGSRGMRMETIVGDLKDYFRDLKDYFN